VGSNSIAIGLKHTEQESMTDRNFQGIFQFPGHFLPGHFCPLPAAQPSSVPMMGREAACVTNKTEYNGGKEGLFRASQFRVL
jgi:hypothetical protein